MELPPEGASNAIGALACGEALVGGYIPGMWRICRRIWGRIWGFCPKRGTRDHTSVLYCNAEVAWLKPRATTMLEFSRDLPPSRWDNPAISSSRSGETDAWTDCGRERCADVLCAVFRGDTRRSRFRRRRGAPQRFKPEEKGEWSSRRREVWLREELQPCVTNKAQGSGLRDGRHVTTGATSQGRCRFRDEAASPSEPALRRLRRTGRDAEDVDKIRVSSHACIFSDSSVAGVEAPEYRAGWARE